VKLKHLNKPENILSVLAVASWLAAWFKAIEHLAQ
jgi:hypothetical protein